MPKFSLFSSSSMSGLLLLSGVSLAGFSFLSVPAHAAEAPASPVSTSDAVSIQNWGALPDGKEVQMITLRNDHGVTAHVLTYGAVLQSLDAPDKNGKIEDITLGWGSLKGYLDNANDGRPYFGATVGRVANRIAGGKFTLNGKTYHTPITNGPNTNHGGHYGFDRRLWKILKTGSDDKASWVTLGQTLPAPTAEKNTAGSCQV